MKKTTIHLLSSSLKLTNRIQKQLTLLGYKSELSKTVSQFQSKIKANESYLLITDKLSLEFLKINTLPVGLLIISELSGFELFLKQAGKLYSQKKIHFLFLEKPFDVPELDELLLRLTQGFKENLLGCLKLPKHGYSEARKIGPILRALRENLGLDRNTVVETARKNHFFISESRLEQIENDESGTDLNGVEWYTLMHMFCETIDCYHVGFEPWSHLRKVRCAIEEKSYLFPLNLALRKKLADLARREQIEKKYYELANQTQQAHLYAAKTAYKTVPFVR